MMISPRRSRRITNILARKNVSSIFLFLSLVLFSMNLDSWEQSLKCCWIPSDVKWLVFFYFMMSCAFWFYPVPHTGLHVEWMVFFFMISCAFWFSPVLHTGPRVKWMVFLFLLMPYILWSSVQCLILVHSIHVLCMWISISSKCG